MRCYVIDASVALKWFVPEIHSEAALRFLKPQRELIAPDLLVPEIGNTLWKKVRRKEILLGAAREILRKFKAAPLNLYPTAPMLEIALNISVEERRSFYDSLYLALALIRKCQVVTADEKLINCFKNRPLAKQLLWIAD